MPQFDPEGELEGLDFVVGLRRFQQEKKECSEANHQEVSIPSLVHLWMRMPPLDWNHSVNPEQSVAVPSVS